VVAVEGPGSAIEIGDQARVATAFQLLPEQGSPTTTSRGNIARCGE